MTLDEAMALMDAELKHYPGHHITEIARGTSYASHGPGDEYRPGLSYRKTLERGWCVTVMSDGWESERERYFHWGSSIPEAIAQMADELTKRRTEPHMFHVLEGAFIEGCAACDADELMLREATA